MARTTQATAGIIYQDMSGPSIYEPVNFYANQSQISNPGRYSALFDTLPTNIIDLCTLLHTLLLPTRYAEELGVDLSRIRTNETLIRTVESKLDRLLAFNSNPLTITREPNNRLVANSRDFSLLLISVLRHYHIPARLRCGFAACIEPGAYTKHWIAEVWGEQEQQWQKVDCINQNAAFPTLSVKMNYLNLPDTAFLPPGLAWIRINSTGINSKKFQDGKLRGKNIVKNALVQDFLCLNRIEPLPNDHFKIANTKMQQLKGSEKQLLDKIAKVTTGESRDFLLMRAVFLTQPDSFLPEYLLH